LNAVKERVRGRSPSRRHTTFGQLKAHIVIKLESIATIIALYPAREFLFGVSEALTLGNVVVPKVFKRIVRAIMTNAGRIGSFIQDWKLNIQHG
jgi:hypothetical protein